MPSCGPGLWAGFVTLCNNAGTVSTARQTLLLLPLGPDPAGPQPPLRPRSPSRRSDFLPLKPLGSTKMPGCSEMLGGPTKNESTQWVMIP